MDLIHDTRLFCDGAIASTLSDHKFSRRFCDTTITYTLSDHKLPRLFCDGALTHTLSDHKFSNRPFLRWVTWRHLKPTQIRFWRGQKDSLTPGPSALGPSTGLTPRWEDDITRNVFDENSLLHPSYWFHSSLRHSYVRWSHPPCLSEPRVTVHPCKTK